MEYTK